MKQHVSWPVNTSHSANTTFTSQLSKVSSLNKSNANIRSFFRKARTLFVVYQIKVSKVITWYFLDQANIANKWRLYNNISVRSFQDFASNRLSVLSDKDLTSAHWRPDIFIRKGACGCLWSRFASFLYRVPVNRLLGAAVSVDPWHARLQILHRVLPKQTGADKWSGCVGSGWASSGRDIDKQQRPQPLQRIQPRR